MRWRLALSLLVLAACGRTAALQPRPPLPDGGGCVLSVDPASVDFGTVQPGAFADAAVTVHNAGGDTCQLSTLGISSDSDPAFSLQTDLDLRTTINISPGGDLRLTVRFAPTNDLAPLERDGTLTFFSNDSQQSEVNVALEGTLPSCTVQVSPTALDFGGAAPRVAVDRQLEVTNVGDGACTLSGAALADDSDAAFTLPSGGFPAAPLAPGAQTSLTVRFDAPTGVLPSDRSGLLTFTTNDPRQPAVQVPLTAELRFCSLAIAPDPFDFGNVVLNATVTDSLRLTNQGLAPCDISSIALAPDTDPAFSLPAAPPERTVAPGQTERIQVAFAAFESAPPHRRQGTLTFTTNDDAAPHAAVPLSAFINTICTEAGQFIYTVDDQGDLSRFDPLTRTSQDIGVLQCPTFAQPFSLNVDQSAIAWVLFDDHRLYRVDTADASCTATAFTPDQHGLDVFGMGSVFSSTTGRDTLYIAGEAQNGDLASTLATLSLSSFQVAPIGPIDVGDVELAGTGDGQLWAFTPGSSSATGAPVLARLDPLTAQTLEQYDVSGIDSVGGFAMKFFGGSFYIFVGQDVWAVDRASLVPGQPEPTTPPQLVFTNPGRDVVGAGVSTCAPVQ